MNAGQARALFETINALSAPTVDTSVFSFSTKLKFAKNIIALQPIYDTFQKSIQPIIESVNASIPSDITDLAEKQARFNAAFSAQEIQSQITPIVETPVDVELVSHVADEFVTASSTATPPADANTPIQYIFGFPQICQFVAAGLLSI